jgi:hypothetical protein
MEASSDRSEASGPWSIDELRASLPVISSGSQNWDDWRAGGWVEVVTDHELDRAIIAALAVQRAEYRTVHSIHRGLTANELALSTGQSVERIEARLIELKLAGRLNAPTSESEEWTSRRHSD